MKALLASHATAALSGLLLFLLGSPAGAVPQ
jgi:hypothetical protein